MEKIISINFHGRVIPIEETAYNSLKQYTDSLRRHFAKEEGSDEIVNDIENRIAELLGDRLKRGAPCISGPDVSAVIDSIGRLEDIEAAESEADNEQARNNSSRQAGPPPVSKGRFFRNEDDKVVAGVCSGIANRIGIDPVIVRVLSVLLIGAFFWVYILLWVIVPSQSIQASITRRLYRNPDDKMIAGVCSGLAAYFKMSTSTVRMIFLIPLVLSALIKGLYLTWWHESWHFGPGILMGSLGGTLFLAYIILWIAIPYASSAGDKLEMRGERVDMNSLKAATQARTSSGGYAPVQHHSSIGHIIGVIFKAFFLLIAGSIALGLFAALVGLLFGGAVAMPYTNFFLDDRTQYIMAWTGIGLVLGIPLIALTTWGLRRIAGVRSGRHYLGYVFSLLWVAGIVTIIMLGTTLASNFSSKHTEEEAYALVQPTGGKLYVNVANAMPGVGHHSKWFHDWDDNNNDFRIVNNDSLWLSTVKVKVTQSPDSLFHMYMSTISRGSTAEQARMIASHINFNISQVDSQVVLPRGFCVSSKDKFRNQQVLVVIEVPVGKDIQLDKNINDYEWFNIDVNRRHGTRYARHHRRHSHHYRATRDYTMTKDGLKRTEDTTYITPADEWADEE